MPSYAIAEHHDPVRHPVAVIDAATPVDALAEYVVGEGFADPREAAREADPEWFYALEAGDAVGCAFTNTELIAFPAELAKGGAMTTHSYVARGGRVYACHADGRVEEAGTALSADGRDLERHARALDVARYQRSVRDLPSRPRPFPSEADRVRVALEDDPTVDDETYGRLVEEADEADERHSWKAEEPDRDVAAEEELELRFSALDESDFRRASLAAHADLSDEEARDALDDAIAEQTGLHPADPGEDHTSRCEVCGDPVREGLRYMAGPFAGRMFCENHDPLRGGPRSGYPELEGGAVNATSTPQEKVAAKIAELVEKAPAGGIFHDATIDVVAKTSPNPRDTKAPARLHVDAPGIADYRMPGPHAPRFEITVTPLS